jgi:hypothetical protein
MDMKKIVFSVVTAVLLTSFLGLNSSIANDYVKLTPEMKEEIIASAIEDGYEGIKILEINNTLYPQANIALIPLLVEHEKIADKPVYAIIIVYFNPKKWMIKDVLPSSKVLEEYSQVKSQLLALGYF